MQIKQIKATEYIDATCELQEMHRQELATYKNIMVLKPDIEKYHTLESKGYLLSLGLFDDDKIVGYSVTFLITNMHYSDVKMAQNDLLYVHPDYRKSKWGLKLIAETEKLAAESGAHMVVWHGKENTAFSTLMPKLGYIVQDIMFSKVL